MRPPESADLPDRAAVHLALPTDLHGRTAVVIARLTHRTLDTTLHELRNLERAGAVRRYVDQGSVVRWVRAGEGDWTWLPPYPPF